MPFTPCWYTLIEELEELPEGATLITPLSHRRFRITDVQEHRVLIRFDNDEKQPLQRDQFEALYEKLQDSKNGFDIDRLPPEADPYPAVLSLHPMYEINEDRSIITSTEDSTETQVIDAESDETEDRTEPEGLDVYSDVLLLIDAVERYDVANLSELETENLVDIYTLLSDVQRDADDLRREVGQTLLNRIHHDRPVPGQYGSVQRTSRRKRSLKDKKEVLSMLEDEGIDPGRVTSVDPDKVDEALGVVSLSESDLYDIEESEYVRKAEVDEDVKESHLQGLKDRLATTEDEQAEELRQEIENLESRIDDLTSFKTGKDVR